MEENKNIEVYSANFKTGSRTYFVNMLEAKAGTKYVKITESMKIGENEYQKNRIILFNEDLRRLSSVLNKAIEKLDKEMIDKDKTPSVQKEIDPLFPNNGKKWTREDEEKLEFLFKAGKTVEDLAEIFGRKEKGILSRLAKLGLTE